MYAAAMAAIFLVWNTLLYMDAAIFASVLLAWLEFFAIGGLGFLIVCSAMYWWFDLTTERNRYPEATKERIREMRQERRLKERGELKNAAVFVIGIGLWFVVIAVVNALVSGLTGNPVFPDS